MEIINPGDIIFSRNNGTISRFIRMRTLSQWSHVGIVTGRYDGNIKCISARWDGVVYDNIKDWYGDIQILRVKNIDSHQIHKVIEYTSTQVGKPYGWCGVKDFLTLQKHQSGSRWFSSVLVYCSFLKAGIDLLEKHKCCFVSPGELYESPKLTFIAKL